jgi:hypothetical protein
MATKWFSCFAKMKDEFRSFEKLPRLRKKQFLRNTKIAETKKTRSKNTKFNYFSFIHVKMPAEVIFGIAGHH